MRKEGRSESALMLEAGVERTTRIPEEAEGEGEGEGEGEAEAEAVEEAQPTNTEPGTPGTRTPGGTVPQTPAGTSPPTSKGKELEEELKVPEVPDLASQLRSSEEMS